MVASVLRRLDTGFLLSAGGEPEDCGRGQRPSGSVARPACQSDFGPMVAFTAPGAVPLNLAAPAACDFIIGPRPKVCPMMAACRRPGAPAGAAPSARRRARGAAGAGQGGRDNSSLVWGDITPYNLRHAGIGHLFGRFVYHQAAPRMPRGSLRDPRRECP